jgi:hypothetical protein
MNLLNKMKTSLEVANAAALTGTIFFAPVILAVVAAAVGNFVETPTFTAEPYREVSQVAWIPAAPTPHFELKQAQPKKELSAKKSVVTNRVSKSSSTSSKRVMHVKVKQPTPQQARLMPDWHKARVEERAATKRKVSPTKGRQCKASSRDGLRKIGENRYRMERELVNEYSNLAKLQSMGRFGRHRNSAGKIDGFWIGNFRCDSVLYQAGLRHGDIITAVNGRQVRTVPQALMAYQRAKHRETIQVQVLRKGRTVKVTYIVS